MCVNSFAQCIFVDDPLFHDIYELPLSYESEIVASKFPIPIMKKLSLFVESGILLLVDLEMSMEKIIFRKI